MGELSAILAHLMSGMLRKREDPEKTDSIMKTSIHLIACCCAVAVCVSSCSENRGGVTPGVVAKQCVEHIMNNDYEAFVENISFVEPVPEVARPAVNRAHATALRAIHHPDVVARGGIAEVQVVSEDISEDNITGDVVVANHYDDGSVEAVTLHMIKDFDMWKVRETSCKEIWRATNIEGDTEIIKVRTGRDRDFFKSRSLGTGEKQFVKDISRPNGQVEIVKALENGKRHREVIRFSDDGAFVDVTVVR